MSAGYHTSRLAPDPKRNILWKALWRYFFSKRIASTDTVLDLGCGYGDFINNVVARRRIAFDQWSRIADYIEADVEAVIAPVTDLSGLADDTIDYAFASNLFEHVSQADFKITLQQLRRKLTKSGSLTLLQPNYRYAMNEYFDDYTHITIWSHIGLKDFLLANDYEVTEVQPRFLPLTVKSRLPVYPILIRLYLALPIKPLGKQMLVVARPKR